MGHTAYIGKTGYNLTGNESRIQLPGLGKPESEPASGFQLNDKEKELMENAKEQGIKRGMTLLSTLTFDWQALAIKGVSSAGSIASASYSYATADAPSTDEMERLSTEGHEVAGEGADKITGVLAKAWDKVEAKMIKDPNIKKLMKVLKVGLQGILTWLKSIVLSKENIATLVPFYGAIKGLISGASAALETHANRTSWDNLALAAPAIGSGYPAVALNAFTEYVKLETIRTAGKATYNFAKTLTSVLLQIFTLGASSIFDFVASIVEAVSSFAYSAFQAFTFGRATDLCRDYVKKRTVMPVDDFQQICSTSPFVGCVFFGAANYMGHFNLTALLSGSNVNISSSSLMSSVAKINEVQLMACKYISSAHFEMKFRSKEEEEQYGWVVKMMKGYSSDAPKSEFLTENASMSTKFKHNGKRLWNFLKK